MPAPTKAQIKPIIDALFLSKNFIGKNINDLSDVLSDAIAQSLAMFMLGPRVMPGIPAIAPPPAFSGSTVGPGLLLPSTLTKAQIKPIIDALFLTKRFDGKNVSDLSDVIAETISLTLMMFTAQVMVMPGIVITGGVTTSPGFLM